MSGAKVTTSSLRRMVVRGAPVRVSMRSNCCVPSHTCQILDTAISAPLLTTKVPM